MLEVFGVMLQPFGFFGGGTAGSLLAQWESLGLFSYILPFLLIFALVFVVMSSIPLFKDNKAVNAIISLAVALMSLQFNFVPMFFSEIFPRFGIAISVIIVLVIIGGLFFDPAHAGFKWIYSIIGLVIVSIVIFKSISAFGWYTISGGWLNVYWSNILIALIVIGSVIAVIASAAPRQPFDISHPTPPVLGGRP